MKYIIFDTLDEKAMIGLIPVENNESVADGNEEVIPKSVEKRHVGNDRQE